MTPVMSALKGLALALITFPIAVLAQPTEQDLLSEDQYLIGRGIADITGPPLGVQMWGFAHFGQRTEGIHLRLKSRAFVISDLAGENKIAFVSADIGSIEHNITLEVVDRLSELYGDNYSVENVILSATHTHSGPMGYWHNRTDSFLSGPFYQEYFETIVAGIVKSIATAQQNLQRGSILINQGIVEGAGANRSLTAYNMNPKEERDDYPSNIDKQMTLLKLTAADQDIGMINWHAVHPTSMTFNNRLISGDHKGYASYAFEQEQMSASPSTTLFVAAFAQANPGDVTSNLNLDNTGPGQDDFESTRIIAERQLAVAQSLFDTASEKLVGKIDTKQVYVDLSNYEISNRGVDDKIRTTCPSAFGYPFFGGSTEDGGGSFLFEEGMKNQNIFYDALARLIFGAPRFTPEVKDCQSPKAILLQTGTGDPPLQTQIRSISLTRIGQLLVLAVPAEVTTMAGRRLRNSVMAQLGDWAKQVVIAGYSNGYAGYVTTPEEYRAQQYEGGHTLHGQWTLAAYEEIAGKLAAALEAGEAMAPGATFDDWRGKTVSSPLRTGEPDPIPEAANFGDYIAQPIKPLREGEAITMKFWSSNPSSNYGFEGNYMMIQKQHNGKWVDVYSEEDWSTKIRWQEERGGYIAYVTWVPPVETSPGNYRLKHTGQFTLPTGIESNFEGTSPTVQLQ